MLALTAIRGHDDLTDWTSVVRLEKQRCWIWYSVGENVVDVELVFFEDQFLEEILHCCPLVGVGIEDRIAGRIYESVDEFEHFGAGVVIYTNAVYRDIRITLCYV